MRRCILDIAVIIRLLSRPIRIAAAFVVLSAWCVDAHAISFTNGSFETGDFTGWTQSGDTSFTSVQNVAPSAQDGSWYAHVGPPTEGFLSQGWVDTPNQTLTISGYVRVRDPGGDSNAFRFIWNGDTKLSFSNLPSQDWTLYQITVTTTGNDSFAIGFRDGPGFLDFDHFSISTVTTPIPSAAILFASASGLLGLFARRRRRQASA